MRLLFPLRFNIIIMQSVLSISMTYPFITVVVILIAQDNTGCRCSFIDSVAKDCQVQNEETIVKRAINKDIEALTNLYESHFDRVYRYIVLRITDRSEAEDLTQQVFLKVIQSIDSYNWKGLPFSAWLFRIARNQVIDYIRKKARTPEFVRDAAFPDTGERATEKQAELGLIMEKVKSAIKGLTPLQQEVISLRFAAGLSLCETAQAMNKREGAVKALQHSALDNLRNILGVCSDEPKI